MALIRVVICDAQYLIREGLKRLLADRNDITISGEAVNENELLHLVKNIHPDVVIVDYEQKGHFSTHTIRKVKECHPESNLLVISSDNKKDNIYSVLELGVNSFLTKQCDGEEIITAIQATAKGERFFCKKVMDYIFERSFQKPEDCSPTRLSNREIEIVQLVASGKIAKEIANELHLSTHTVYTHRKNIMKKLGLASSSELVLYAVRSGILSST